ncbi:sigma-54 factor interaction domain-containing protein [Chromobacterium haemolyticum]|nr:sigma-54 factor interaction domain-containing protein [Chromobacterium haemolyticum]
MQALRETLANIADTDADVLIHGETGTGKEMVAQALHAWSRRRERHFVPLNCAGLPESIFESEIFGHEAGAFTGALKRRIGKIEYASGGTLFLDEIEGMPLALQAKLLRVLQQRVVERLGSNSLIPVDCRVVAATKDDLALASRERRFREDLYYRLNVCRCGCRRCVSGARTFRTCSSGLWNKRRHASTGRRRTRRQPYWDACRRRRGRAMFASCATRRNAMC